MRIFYDLTLIQGELHWAEPEHDKVPPRSASSPSAQDDQASPKAEGCVRLRRQLTQECVQHPHRLHAVPGKIQCVRT